MLLQFRFKNFKSFAEEVVFDMTATSIREHGNSLIDVNGNKILPVAAIYGGNASGKSNFFEAYKCMDCMVQGMTKAISIKSFIFDTTCKEEPTEFEVCFLVKDIEYRYGFVCKKEVIYEEWLFHKVFKKGTRSKEKCVFYRCDGEVRIEDKDKKEKGELEYIFSMVRNDELLLTSIGKRKVSKYYKVYEAFDKCVVIDFSFDNDEEAIKELVIKDLYQNEDLFNLVKKCVNEFDPDIYDIKILKEKNNSLEEVYNVYTYHKGADGELIKFPLEMESRGTKKFFVALECILFALNGGVLFVDELDSKLHPLILRYIVRMFTDPTLNKGKGQLIFSAHNLICLDSNDLRRDEIWFVEKNNQRSTIFSLYDFKMEDSSVRSDMNFGKNYLSGRFGAIPFQERED